MTKQHLTDGVLRQYIRFLLESRISLHEEDDTGVVDDSTSTKDAGELGFYDTQKVSEIETRSSTFKTELGDAPFFFTKIANFGDMKKVTI